MFCAVEGCGKLSVNSRGWCNAHYLRWRAHGDPTAGRTPNGEPLRFLTNVVLTHGGTDCLFWPYGRGKDGCACIWLDGRQNRVPRIVCEDRNGPPPSEEHEAAHSCGKGKLGCVSPIHLRWATSLENSADMIGHGTQARGDTCPASKLTSWQAREILELKGVLYQREIAELYDTSQGTVSAIHNGKRWTEGTQQ